MALAISGFTALAVGVGAVGVGMAIGGSRGGGKAAASQAAIAQQQQDLAKEQFEFSKQVYSQQAAAQEEANAIAREVGYAQMESMRQNDRIAKETYDYQVNTFRPIEQRLVNEANNYDTPQRRAEEMAKATAGVETQLSAQREATVQENMRRSVNPNSMKMQAMQGTMDIQASKVKAGVSSAASDKVEQLGYARSMDAASLGKGLATDRVNATNAALSAGNSAVSNAQVPTNGILNGGQFMQNGYNSTNSALASAASTYGSIANREQANQDAQMAALGQVGGMALYKWSDKDMKTDFKAVDEEKAVDVVMDTPVTSWAYKAGTIGAQEEGTEPKVGPTAQDVNKNMGERVAPGGKKIDLVSMNGILMAAVKGLAKKVDSIAANAGTMQLAA